jgi:Phosphotransferase enzyme family
MAISTGDLALGHVPAEPGGLGWVVVPCLARRSAVIRLRAPRCQAVVVLSVGEIREWVAVSWPEWEWSDAVVEHGSFHDVVVLSGRVVARVATGPGRCGRVQREMSTLGLVADTGVGVVVPRLLSPLVDRDGACGLLTSFVSGRDGVGRDWAEVRPGYAALLTDFAAVPLDGPAADLPPVRTWCGGPEWPALVESALLPRLSAVARPAAVEAVKAMVAVEREAPRQFVHGDFGPHNVRWEGRAVSGILDLDHTRSVTPPSISRRWSVCTVPRRWPSWPTRRCCTVH